MPSSPPSPAVVHTISTCTVKPPPHPRRSCHLTPWDIAMLSAHYIQKGLLFANPPSSSSLDPQQLIEHLKSSLSVALLHFYPLAGRLVTEEDRDADGEVKSTSVYIDCDGQGAEFVHAAADGIKVADVLALSGDLPEFLRDFFKLDGAVNHDGHFSPLLSVQLTELADGVFLDGRSITSSGTARPTGNSSTPGRRSREPPIAAVAASPALRSTTAGSSTATAPLLSSYH
uniref:Uncharacterized protein n=1 Tax=Ananas comosus var. bracteatus TaxID=296719 RepID=A0A6V7QJA2_ANACO|nr:unnamed protein product [Ananas comosus var. bracteatus]